MSQTMPSLTVNRSFLTDLIEADKPCCALGMVEVEDQQCGFVALRPEPMIPPGVTKSWLQLRPYPFRNQHV